MSDRIAVMNAGKVEQLGTPEGSTSGRRPVRGGLHRPTNLLTGLESADASSAFVRLDGVDACVIAGMGCTSAGRWICPSVRNPFSSRPRRHGARGRRTDPRRGRTDGVPRGQRPYHVRTRGGLAITA